MLTGFLDLNYIDVLREVYPHFSVKQNAYGRMLQTENGKRLKLSSFEFNLYDYAEL